MWDNLAGIRPPHPPTLHAFTVILPPPNPQNLLNGCLSFEEGWEVCLGSRGWGEERRGEFGQVKAGRTWDRGEERRWGSREEEVWVLLHWSVTDVHWICECEIFATAKVIHNTQLSYNLQQPALQALHHIRAQMQIYMERTVFHISSRNPEGTLVFENLQMSDEWGCGLNAKLLILQNVILAWYCHVWVADKHILHV